jgi:Baseplate J-like protein
MTSPTAATISATGIAAPNFAQILAYLKAGYQGIFGADAYLGNDSQDGQLLALIAQGFADHNAADIASYNSFSPATGQGNGLSSNVKINGLKRLTPSFSTSQVTLTGQANLPIANGFVQDANGNSWALPALVTIGAGGTVTVTATCIVAGAIAAGSNTLTIQTPVLGWQSVTNTSAVLGNPVEADAALRVRQSGSTTLPSQTIFSGIVAAIQQIVGVTRAQGYENATAVTDANGIPPGNLAFVVEGGTALTIATAIAGHIAPGVPTYLTGSGSTQTITDAAGYSKVIKFMTPTESTIIAQVTVHPLTGWAASTIPIITAAISAYLSALPIGQPVNMAAITIAAALLNTPYQGTYLVKSVQANKNAGGFQSTDIAMAFNEAATPGTSTVSTV